MYRNVEHYYDPTAGKGIANAKRSISGLKNKENGALFETMIAKSIKWYQNKGILKADKIPEPMKPISKRDRNGHFKACYIKKAQVDFCGTLYGGRAVRWEAKMTDGEKMAFNRLTQEQMEDLDGHSQLGALCFVLCCFNFKYFYRVPWFIWKTMKEQFGRKYVKETDIAQYKVPFVSGYIMFLDRIDEKTEAPLPDRCVVCGEYPERDL